MTWRVGRKVLRNLYKDEQIAGQMQSDELAAEVVAALNMSTPDTRSDDVSTKRGNVDMKPNARTSKFSIDNSSEASPAPDVQRRWECCKESGCIEMHVKPDVERCGHGIERGRCCAHCFLGERGEVVVPRVLLMHARANLTRCGCKYTEPLTCGVCVLTKQLSEALDGR